MAATNDEIEAHVRTIPLKNSSFILTGRNNITFEAHTLSCTKLWAKYNCRRPKRSSRLVSTDDTLMDMTHLRTIPLRES